MSAPLSVLDLSPISEGGTARQALRNSLDLARSAEAWGGYKRYWVAEHHFVGVASSSPAVLVGLIAAATNTIRVGSAAVLLGNNTAAQVVEAFGTVEALYPGRIDLGIGRSGQRRVEALRAVAAGTPAPAESKRENVVRDGVVIPAPFDPTGLLTSPRLQASFEALAFPGAQAPDFEQQVDDIRSLLNGTYRTRDGIELHASPGENATSNCGCSEAVRAPVPSSPDDSECRSVRITMWRPRVRSMPSRHTVQHSDRRQFCRSRMSSSPRMLLLRKTMRRRGSWRRPSRTGRTAFAADTAPSRTPPIRPQRSHFPTPTKQWWRIG